MFGVPERLVIRMIDAGWVYRMRGVWRKLNSMPGPWKDRFTHQWEPVYLFTPEPDYWFDVDDVREPHQADSHRRAKDSYNGAKTWNPDPHASRMHQFDKPLHPRGKNPGDVFEVSNPGYPDAHYAVFPDELVIKPIKAGCPPVVCAACGTPYDRDSETVHENPWQRETNGSKYLDRQHETAGFDRRLNAYHYPGEWEAQCDCDAGTQPGVVLDPFAGRGTVGKVAAQHGRRHVLIDLDPESVDLATDYVPSQRNGTLVEFAQGGTDD